MRTMGCLAEASYLLRIIMFLRIAYGLGNVFNDIRGETSAFAQDGPSDVPKTDRGPSYAQLIHPMLTHNMITYVPTRYRLPLLHSQYMFVFMKENLELKSHYMLCLIRRPMLQGQHVLVISQN